MFLLLTGSANGGENRDVELEHLPIGLARNGYFKKYYDKMGPPRYYIGISLFLTMMIMPIKMYCRWMFNLKYFVHIQEFFLNF